MGQNQDPIAERDKFGMPEDTPDFNIDPDSGMTPPAEFPYNGHQVEILPPDTEHLIGKYWQIKIDGVIRGNFLFSSTRTAADEAIKLIDNVSFTRADAEMRRLFSLSRSPTVILFWDICRILQMC
jgi:hypothetical protein